LSAQDLEKLEKLTIDLLVEKEKIKAQVKAKYDQKVI